MNRHISFFVTLFSFLALVTSGCANKKGVKSAGGSETDVSSGSGSSSGTEGDASGSAGGGALSMPTVYFEFDQAVIRSEDRPALQKAAEGLKSEKGVKVTIEGHCDERGSHEYNLALGERRSQAVKSYLRNLGVEADRLSTISYGEERPVDSTSGETAWAKNRRGELLINR